MKDTEDNEALIEAWLKKNKPTKCPPRSAQGTKQPGLSCANYDRLIKPGTPEEFAQRRKSYEEWQEKKARWAKERKALRKAKS